MSTILKEILLGAVRQFLTPILTAALLYAVGHAWITPDQQHQVTLWFDGWINVVAITIVAAAPGILWSAWSKLKARYLVHVALRLPSTATEATVAKVADQASIVTVLNTVLPPK